MTPANVHDSRLGEALIQGDEQGFFADRAYDSQTLRETLERRGLVDGIAWKVKHARYPLETWQQAHNAWASSVRSAAERAFATNEALVWNGPRPLSGAGPQRLSSAVRRDGDEHEASARAYARGLTRPQERRPREPRKANYRWLKNETPHPSCKTRYPNLNPIRFPATHPLLQSS
jgi:IS5 family transposase